MPVVNSRYPGKPLGSTATPHSPYIPVPGPQGPQGAPGKDAAVNSTIIEKTTEVRYVNTPEIRYIERSIPVVVVSQSVSQSVQPTVHDTARGPTGEPAVSQASITRAIGDWLQNKTPMEVLKLTSEPGMLKYRPPTIPATPASMWDENERAKARVKVVRQ